MPIKINSNNSIGNYNITNIQKRNNNKELNKIHIQDVENQKKNINKQQQIKKTPEAKFPLGNQVDIKA